MNAYEAIFLSVLTVAAVGVVLFAYFNAKDNTK